MNLSFNSAGPGTCIIKLITVTIYGFRNKLECLSLNKKLGWKGLPGTIYGFRNKLERLSLNKKLGWKGLPGTNTILLRKP
jgi:hypothetical protein